MGRRRMHAAFILYKTLGYPELRFILHALLNKNHAFLFNTIRLLNISANFAVDYQHH